MNFRLIYTSKATNPSSLQDILAESIAWNRSHALTGGLVFLQGTYLQYLEGDRSDVEEIFSQLVNDPRHTGVKVLERRAVTKRMFASWSMAVLDWNSETTAIFQSFSPGHPIDLYKTDPTTAAPLFRAWAATKHWKAGAITSKVNA